MIGETAALVTAVSWAGSSLLFTAASRRRGPTQLNLVRLVVATGLLAAAVLVTSGDWAVPGGQALALGLSGIVGLSLGDGALFHALRILGPRRAMLLMALAPVMTAVIMAPLLGETLDGVALVGMCVATVGIIWVQMERDDGTEIVGRASTGVICGVLAALGQAVGLVLAKVGLGAAPADAWLVEQFAESGQVVIEPLLGTLVRMAVGASALVGAAVVFRPPEGLREAVRDPHFLRPALAGTVLGPVIGIWLSMVAVANANTAVAATILASAPVFVIPLTRLAHGHRASWRAWTGALVALLGVALLAARHQLVD